MHALLDIVALDFFIACMWGKAFAGILGRFG